MSTESSPHIIVISNRGPFSFSVRNGKPVAQRGAGGLATALSNIANQHDVLWVSCAMSKGDREWLQLKGQGIHTVENMRIRLVVPDPVQYHAYYNVISNPLLWFTQHQMHNIPRFPIIDAATWKAWHSGYTAINCQLAEVVAETVAELEGSVIVMPQDYHLYLFPKFLRQMVEDRVFIQSFLHIPWPGPDAWQVLPTEMRHEILDGMLHANRIGFQTERDTRRFLQTCTANLPEIKVTQPWRKLKYKGREIEAAPYPISVDVDGLKQELKNKKSRRQFARWHEINGNRKMILRVDRVEPSKNILRGLMAFQNFLTAYPGFRKKVYMLALLVPSRSEISVYKDYLRDVMALVGEINATFAESNWEPIRVMLGNNYTRALHAFSQYDILMVNPLADGMNLVAKEGVVLNQRNGVLILSEQAGAAEEMGNDALLISPYDVYGTREAIYKALTMSKEERRSRAENLATQVQQHDIHYWFKRQLEDIDQAAQSLARPNSSPSTLISETS